MALPSYVDRARSAALCLALAAGACSSDHPASASRKGDASAPDAAPTAAPADGATSPVTPAPEGSPYDTLAEWHLFTDPVKQLPNDRVIPYDVNAALFADYATKYRFMYVPAGQHIGYQPTDKWDLPVGTILVKTFSFLADARDPTKGQRLLETRLLIHESGGWMPHTYVWDAAQTTASLEVAGDSIDATFIGPSGQSLHDNYSVPNENDCRGCHGKLGVTNTLGGRTRQLNRDHDYGSGNENQIDHLQKLGLFAAAPEPATARQTLADPFGTAPIFERVRAYFDGNCGHCHQPGTSEASPSGLWLDYASTDGAKHPDLTWGICKEPASAGGATCGNRFDVVPGSPDVSVLICRMNTTSPKARMPQVGRNLIHTEGVALMMDWINSLSAGCGQTGPTVDAGHSASVPDAASEAGATDASKTDSGPG